MAQISSCLYFLLVILEAGAAAAANVDQLQDPDLFDSSKKEIEIAQQPRRIWHMGLWAFHQTVMTVKMLHFSEGFEQKNNFIIILDP